MQRVDKFNMDAKTNCSYKVKAILTQNISYKKLDNSEIIVLHGTEIMVDPVQNIAVFGFDHIFIAEHEYKVLYKN